MSSESAELALQLDEVVRGVPGVVALFSTRPAVVQSARELAPASPVALVTVSRSSVGVSIEVSVGVASETQAPVTARGVSQAIRDALETGTPADIHVRIARVA
jgi:hypothetical protein